MNRDIPAIDRAIKIAFIALSIVSLELMFPSWLVCPWNESIFVSRIEGWRISFSP